MKIMIIRKQIVLASIYKNGDFDRNTIPNDLILKIGFDDLDYALDNVYWKGDGTYVIGDKGNYIWTIPKDLIEKNIKNMFGNIKYQHNSLKSTELSNNFGNCLPTDAVYLDNKQYQLNITCLMYIDIINQIPYKVETMDNNKKINIYVKTYYNDSLYCGNYEYALPGIRKVYKSYDYTNNKFDDADFILIESVRHADEYVDGNELRSCIYKMVENTGIKVYDESISLIEIDKLKDYDFFDKLDSYVYTFELSSDGNYYLYSFKKVV